MRDYNRARCYLADLAEREGVPLYEDIGESVDALAQTLRKELGTNSSASGELTRPQAHP